MGAHFTGLEALLCAGGYLGGLAPLLLRRDWTVAEREQGIRRYCWTYGPLLGLPAVLTLAGGLARHEAPEPGAWLAALLLPGSLAALRYGTRHLTGRE